MAYPTLKYKSVEIVPEDNVIKSDMQNGSVITRKKFTKTRRTFNLTPTKMTDADYALLKSHYESVETHSSFQVVNPLDSGDTPTVRFAKPFYGKKDARYHDRYDVSTIELTEV